MHCADGTRAVLLVSAEVASEEQNWLRRVRNALPAHVEIEERECAALFEHEQLVSLDFNFDFDFDFFGME